MDDEQSFRQGMPSILEDVGLKVEQYLVYDDEGEVFGRPEQVELDIVMRDQELPFFLF